MIIDYSPGEEMSLVEAEDFKSFKLRLRSTSGPRPVLPGVAFVDDLNVLIAIDAVTQLPGNPGTEEWHAGFRKMIDYAETKGWIDTATNSIRAHVERTP